MTMADLATADMLTPGGTSAGVRTLVIVPTYNERENLPRLVGDLMLSPDWHVWVVDDGSPDGTGEVADRLAAEFPGRIDAWHRTGKRGLGRSYLDAFSRAVSEPWDVICQMDADLSHDPQYLPAMVAATADHDLVIGSRYMQGVSVVNWPLRRIFLSTMANRYIRTVTRLKVTDCTGGYRCWRREALAAIPLDRIVSDGYSFMVEMLYEAARAGCRIQEVPIVFVERRQGQSKLSTGVLAESVLMPWRLVLRRRPAGRVPAASGAQGHR
jgi:dolichol-phosphate mannosyltransferase